MAESTRLKLLIDAEVFMFRAAAASEHEVEWAPDDWTYLCRHGDAKAHFDETIGRIQDVFPDHQATMCFSDGRTFRYSVWPKYKRHRRKYRKPAGLLKLMEWIREVCPTRGWRHQTLQDVEGDDVLGILKRPGDVVASLDKDMATLPGLLLRNVPLADDLDGVTPAVLPDVVEISPVQADLAFFTQTLTGDTADGYPGCPGMGPVKAEKALAGLATEREMWKAVVTAFAKAGLSFDDALRQARCARILRAGEYDMDRRRPVLWVPPPVA